MGSLDTPKGAENTTTYNGGKNPPPANGASQTPEDSAVAKPELEASNKRRSSMLPLEVGTRVMCRWRDGKFHPVKVIERRKLHPGGSNDYEYYVHYTECKDLLFDLVFRVLLFFCLIVRIVRRNSSLLSEYPFTVNIKKFEIFYIQEML